MRYPAYIGATTQAQALTADQEQLFCMYVERADSPGSASPAALYPTPGVTLIATAMSSPGRAHFFMGGREFAVFGTSLVEIDSSANLTVRGTVASDANPATISSNGDGGDQLFITSGGNGYCFNLTTNVLTQIAALNGKATMGGFLDSYFLALDANTSTFYISALLDGMTWATGTDFAQRSAGPDPWLAQGVVGQFVWNFGQLTSEVWYDTGSASFPFGLHPSGRVPYGIAAPFSVADTGGVLLWLSRSTDARTFVLRASGFTPEVVSPPWLQGVFDAMDTVSDAVGEFINWQGHPLYRLTFPTEDVTWCYDLKTDLWFKWGTWISENNAYSASRTRWHVIAGGEHRMLDAATGALYRVDAASMLDVDGRPLRPERIGPALSAENQRIFYSYLELFMDVGLGAVTGDGVDPQVMLRLSRDGGRTWGSEIWRSAGKIGEYGKRVRWERLGMARNLVARTAFALPVPFRVVDCFIGTGQPVKGASRAGAAA